MAAGLVKDKEEMRRIVRYSTELETFEPSNKELWDNQYRKYLEVYKEL